MVYWSGTGNTQAMAEAVASAAGAELFTADAFSGEKLDAYDAIGFGCPSMGSEQLEESEFEPMFEGCKSHLNGNTAIFIILQIVCAVQTNTDT